METQRNDYYNNRNHHYNHQHDHQHANYQNPNNQFHHDNHSANYDYTPPLNNPAQNAPFGDSGGFHSNNRRRNRFGSDDGSGCVKLYIAPVPRSITQEDVWNVFGEHGNVVEVVIPWDKRIGQQQAYCFVKYATVDDAERAIRALNNQYTFAGETNPVKVRYADGEQQRFVKIEREPQPGGFVDRLYVGCINKHASKEDIEEIFSSYGCVEDVFIARDERGFAFVKFSHRDMAVAAIEALHGTLTMKGCDQPLVVRFADPRKPRFGELRGNYAFGRPNFVPGPQEPPIRPAPMFGDSIGGGVLANAPYPMQEPNIQPQAVSFTMKQEPAAAHITGQCIIPQPAQVTQLPSQHAQVQAPAEPFQSSQQVVSEVQRQTQNLEQQERVHSPPQEIVSNIQVDSSTSAVPAAPSSPQTADQQDCDWSEHTCPDGYKYYYNCTTCESRWEKPEGFAIFRQELQKKQKLDHSGQPSDASSPVVSAEVVVPSVKGMDGEEVYQKTSSADD